MLEIDHNQYKSILDSISLSDSEPSFNCFYYLFTKLSDKKVTDYSDTSVIHGIFPVALAITQKTTMNIPGCSVT